MSTNGCPYCQFQWETYWMLRTELGFPAHVVQEIHRLLCVVVIDASAELVEQRLLGGQPTVVLLWNPECPFSQEFMRQYERFAQLSQVRAMRLAVSRKRFLHSALDTLIVSTPMIFGMARGHVIVNPHEFFYERSAQSLLCFARRLVALGRSQPLHGTVLRKVDHTTHYKMFELASGPAWGGNSAKWVPASSSQGRNTVDENETHLALENKFI